MLIAPVPTNEVERLAAVRALNILDTPDEERYDRITDMAMQAFQVPVAFVAMLDQNRLWLKSKKGSHTCQLPRNVSFCGHAIAAGEMLVVPDALADSRFADNPLVTGDPYVRFYAGQPLAGPGGHYVGTLCMIDHKPREFSERERALLKALANMVEKEMEFTDVIRLQSELITTKQNLIESRERLAKELREAESYMKTLLPPPIQEKYIAINWRFMPSSDLGGDAFGYGWLDENRFYLYIMDVAGHGVGAALLSTSIMNTMRSKTLPGADFISPPSVLQTLNNAYHMECQDGRYFSMWYGVYDRRDRSLVYSSAGHPPALLVTGESAEDNRVTELGHGGFAVGLMDDAAFETHRVTLGKYAKLYAFSDGIYEAQDGNGSMGFYQQWLDYLSEATLSPDFSIDKIMVYIKKRHEGESFDDDISILEAKFE